MSKFARGLTIVQFFFASIVFGQTQTSPHSSQIIIAATPARDSVTVQLTIPLDVKSDTLTAKLNGKDVSKNLAPANCKQATCEQAIFTSADGLHESKNVLSVVAKRKSGGLASTLARFVGTSAPTAIRRAAVSGSKSADASAALPTLSDFLPPALAFNTLTPGGRDDASAWFQIGSQNTYSTNNYMTSCQGFIYTVVVLDRQTLQERTAAPELSPKCISDGVSLKAYLATLSTADLVVVGSNTGENSDAGAAKGQLDTSPIGGTAYNCVASTDCSSLPATTVKLSDVPMGYMAIGVGGAASGSAYENYYLANEPWYIVVPYATGTLVEDPNGNYNFQTSNAVEYTITPNDPTNESSISTVSVKTAPGDPYYSKGIFEKRYSPALLAATQGIWVLKLQRSTLFSVPFDNTQPIPVSDADACQETPHIPPTPGVANFDECGRYYFTGVLDQALAAGSYSQLADDLASENSNELVFVVTTGKTPGYPGLTTSTLVSTPLANAFSALGGTPETLIGLGVAGATYSYVGCVTCGNSLGGHVVISSSLQSQQGQSGYIHGLLQPNLNGLYWPTQASLDQPGADGAPTTDLTIQEVTATQPVDWPELSTTVKLTSGAFTADSTGGQNAAYYYIGYQLINNFYIVGAQGNKIDDIHYYFTSGNNTFLDYHYYDPANLTFPGATPTTCFTWTDPVPTRGTLACFTQNDFNAVRAQMHNEILYLTNVLQFMVTGSTNMKDIVASSGGSAALALINAAAAVEASTLQPPPAMPIKSNVSNILNLIGNAVSTAATIASTALAGPEASESVQLLLKIVGPSAGVTSGSFGMASAITGGLHTAGGPSPIPSRDYPFLTTIADLSNNQLQQGFTAGFDSGLDTILADWYKLSTIGPKITDSSQPGFQTPTQSTQLIGITQIGRASQRSFYMALLPVDYSVQHYTYWFGDPSITNNPDMGARTEGISADCNTWYYSAPAPSTINLVSKYYLSFAGAKPTGFAFWNKNFTPIPIPMPIDWYVLASSATPTKAGTLAQQIQLLDPAVATTLFSSGQLNIPLDPFLDIAGPMASVWADSATLGFDHFPADQTCSLYVAGKYGNTIPDGSVGGPQPIPVVKVTLNVPASGVLGDNVALQATAVSGSTPITSSLIAFSDGNTEMGRVPLDATGTATLNVTTLSLGTHTISASFVATTQYGATIPVTATLTIYANDPDLSIALSAADITATSGATSAPLDLQVTSKRGLAGTVAFSCSGLPAGAICNFTPSQVTLTDGSSASTSLTISDQRQTAGLSPALPLLAGILLPLPWLRLRKNAAAVRKSLCANMVVFMLLSLFLAACGGSSNPPPPAMQPISSTVLVTATAGKISRSVPINLTLQ